MNIYVKRTNNFVKVAYVVFDDILILRDVDKGEQFYYLHINTFVSMDTVASERIESGDTRLPQTHIGDLSYYI